MPCTGRSCSQSLLGGVGGNNKIRSSLTHKKSQNCLPLHTYTYVQDLPNHRHIHTHARVHTQIYCHTYAHTTYTYTHIHTLTPPPTLSILPPTHTSLIMNKACSSIDISLGELKKVSRLLNDLIILIQRTACVRRTCR